jgi:hypothetical protein
MAGGVAVEDGNYWNPVHSRDLREGYPQGTHMQTKTGQNCHKSTSVAALGQATKSRKQK